MNCETKAVFPTPESPSKTTLYFEILSSTSLSVLMSCPLQQEPSNGDLSPDTLLFLQTEKKVLRIAIIVTKYLLIQKVVNVKNIKIAKKLLFLINKHVYVYV